MLYSVLFLWPSHKQISETINDVGTFYKINHSKVVNIYSHLELMSIPLKTSCEINVQVIKNKV